MNQIEIINCTLVFIAIVAHFMALIELLSESMGIKTNINKAAIGSHTSRHGDL